MIDRIKVLFVVPSLDLGGAENLLVATINELKADHDIYLIVLGTGGSLISQIDLQADRILILGDENLHTISAKIFISSSLAAFKIKKFLRKKRLNLIVAHLPIAHLICRLTVILCRFSFMRVRLVNYHHSMDVFRHSSLNANIFVRFNRLLSRGTDFRNICVSMAVAMDISRYTTLKKKAIVIYNYAEDDRLASNDLKKDQGAYWVVIPGRLEAVKGQLFFMKALENFNLKEFNNLNLKFIFVGGGSQHETIEALATSRGWAHQVQFTGYVTHTVMLNYMECADLIVIPSLSEGLGITAIEALMLGKLVLASDTGGLPEIIIDRETGVLFESGNSSELVILLKRILLRNISIDRASQQEYYKKHFTKHNYFSVLKLNLLSFLVTNE